MIASRECVQNFKENYLPESKLQSICGEHMLLHEIHRLTSHHSFPKLFMATWDPTKVDHYNAEYNKSSQYQSYLLFPEILSSEYCQGQQDRTQKPLCFSKPIQYFGWTLLRIPFWPKLLLRQCNLVHCDHSIF